MLFSCGDKKFGADTGVFWLMRAGICYLFSPSLFFFGSIEQREGGVVGGGARISSLKCFMRLMGTLLCMLVDRMRWQEVGLAGALWPVYGRLLCFRYGDICSSFLLEEGYCSEIVEWRWRLTRGL